MTYSGRRKRILHCTTSLTFGGETTLLRRTIPYLDSSRFESIVCSIRTPSVPAGTLSSLDCPVFSLGVNSRFDVAGGVLRLRRLIREYDIDLIHAHIFGTEREVFLAGRATGVPVLGTLTTTFDPALQAGPGNKVLLWRLKAAHLMFGQLARLSGAHFIGLSEWVKESAVRHLGVAPDRVDVVSIGLIPEDFEPTQESLAHATNLRASVAPAYAWPLLVTVGRLSSAKSQAELLRALPHIVEKHERAHLLIAGDGPLLEELTALAAGLGISSHVSFLGKREDVRALLQASDIFVFSSRYEGVPHSVIEAMASAKPVIAFDIPALREVVEDGVSGRLVRTRESKALAEAVISVAEDPPLAQRMAERASLVVREKFDVRKNIRPLMAIYDRMTGTYEAAQAS